MLVTKFPMPERCRIVGPAGEDITEIVLRETTGKDEVNAATKAKAKGDHGNQLEEMIVDSLVSVNGVAVNTDGRPYDRFPYWNSRARAFAMKAWSHLNGVGEDEGNPFVKGAESVLRTS